MTAEGHGQVSSEWKRRFCWQEKEKKQEGLTIANPKIMGETKRYGAQERICPT